MTDEKKDPLERMAGAFEKIADQLESLVFKVEYHAESVQGIYQGMHDMTRQLSQAMRGEERSRDDEYTFGPTSSN